MSRNLNYFVSSIIPNQKAHTIQILKMCDALSSFYKVNLICEPAKKKKNLKKNFNLKNNFKIRRINIYKSKILNMLFKIYYLFIFKNNKDDILFTRDVHYAFFGKFFYRKIFLELHQNYLKKTHISYYFLKIIFRCNNIKLIFISKELYKIYKANFGRPNKYVIAHDASDDNFSKKPSGNIYNKKNISVGYCGHLYKGRGIELLIKLAQVEKSINFNILGGFKNDKEKILFNKNIPKNIFFYPHVAYTKTSKFLTSNDILIAPYQKKLGGKDEIDTAKYMSPLKIFEYMSSKKAIICSNHKVLKEVLIDKKNSILCDPDNFNHWIKALKRLKNKKYRSYLANNAYKYFKKNHTWEIRVIKIFK